MHNYYLLFYIYARVSTCMNHPLPSSSLPNSHTDQKMKLYPITFFIFFAIRLSVASPAAEKPDPDRVPQFARWLVSHSIWGVLSTLTPEGSPFGYVASFSDAGTGVPYFYLSKLDPTSPAKKKDLRASFTLSEVVLGTCTTDPQSPVCSKITLSGTLIMLDQASDEAQVAEAALFTQHPEFGGFPKQNGTFAVFKLVIQDIFLVNKSAPRRDITVGDYLGA